MFFHEIAVVKDQGLGEFLLEIGEWVYEDGDKNNAIDKTKETATAVVRLLPHTNFGVFRLRG